MSSPSTDTGPKHEVSKPERYVNQFALVFFWIGALGVIVLMFLTIIGVVWRYVLNDPIIGVSDISTLCLIIVATCSVAYGATQNSHVSVNIIKMFFERSVTRVTDIVMRLGAIFITGLAAYALYSRACGFEKACVTTNLTIEHLPFYYVLALGMLFYMVVFILHLIQGLKYFTTEDPNEPVD